ncbi:cytochrome b [Methylobacterium gregans]|uniref:cytochrome b n=1 Tax=Methylobacterium gregans TaxID=374424 RepID=UPI00361DF73D
MDLELGCRQADPRARPVPAPALTAPAREWYDLAKLAHVTLAWGTGALVLGHVLIALKHHFLDKDGILRGMLPDRRSAAPLAARTRP